MDRIEARALFEDWKSFFSRLFHSIRLKRTTVSEARGKAFEIYSDPDMPEALIATFLEEIQKAQDENKPLYQWAKNEGWVEFKKIVENYAREAAVYCNQIAVDERIRRDKAVIVNCLGQIIATIEGRAQDFKVNAFIRKLFNEANYKFENK